ncbi:MAG: hypothetical protein ACOVOV_06940 [Dolichospermum sp.]
MIGYVLTIEQKEDIQGKEYAPYQIFNCVQDINDVWFTFLTNYDKISIIRTEYKWLLSCPQGEYIPPPPPPFPPIN